jgi:adenylate cyclase
MLKKLFQTKWFTSTVQGLLVGTLVAIFCTGSFFSFLQYLVSDLLYIGYPPSDNIVIVAIDNESLQGLGRWPWDREIVAGIIDKISEKNPKAIGIDISFPEEQTREQDTILQKSIIASDKVILPIEGNLYFDKKGDKALTSQNTLYPIGVLQKAASRTGFVNVTPDADGVVRSLPLLVKDQAGTLHEAFSLKIIREYLDLPEQPAYPLLKEGHYKVSQTEIPIDELSLMKINFSGKPGSFKTYSASEVLNQELPEIIFKNKIVLIGATASSLHDEFPVPISKNVAMAGVEIQANAIQTFLDKKFLFQPDKKQTIWLIFILSIGLSFLLSRLTMRNASLICAISTGIILLLSFVLFGVGVLFETLYFLLAIGFVYIGDLSYKYFYANEQKAVIKKVFQYYVSSPIVDELLKSPDKIKLGGESRTVTILFSDIRGFTNISEKMPAEELIQYLNEYLEIMTNVIIEKQGVIDKFIGDAIMAFWNAPINLKNHETLAIKAGLEMISKLEAFNSHWKEKGYEPIKIGIGLNTGEVIAGNIGSSKRFDYTIVGDNVNLGSRVEGLNKVYGTSLLITESTYNKTKNKFPTRLIDFVRVKGKDQPIKLYEVLATKKTKKWLHSFENALTLYRSKEFTAAKQIFEKLIDSKTEDKVTEIYINRCNDFIKNPPPKDWDGVFEHKKK